MNFVDTHCHIQSAGLAGGEPGTWEVWRKRPDLTGDRLVQNAVAVSVSKMICVGCDLADSRLAINFAQNHQNCYASIGIHPHEASKHLSKKAKSQFTQLLGDGSQIDNKIVAIGECGLDYFYNYSPGPAQIELLKFQIELALEVNLPMIFHVRDAFDDFWPVFESYSGIRGVLHSFTDSKQNLERALRHNLFIGVNGIATFAKDPAQLAVYKSIPIKKILLETDAPYLTPAPYRGKLNEPKLVRLVAEFLSELRGEDIESLAVATSRNADVLFNVGVKGQ
ncbi:MAG: TatD family hydrolase [Candidatus Saccharimonadales bacterium]